MLFVHLFVLYMLVFVLFLFLLVSGLAAVSDCGTPLSFLLTVLLRYQTVVLGRIVCQFSARSQFDRDRTKCTT